MANMYGDSYITKPLNAVVTAIGQTGMLLPTGIAIAGIDYISSMVLQNVNIGGSTGGNILGSVIIGLARAVEIKTYMLSAQ